MEGLTLPPTSRNESSRSPLEVRNGECRAAQPKLRSQLSPAVKALTSHLPAVDNSLSGGYREGRARGVRFRWSCTCRRCSGTCTVHAGAGETAADLRQNALRCAARLPPPAAACRPL